MSKNPKNDNNCYTGEKKSSYLPNEYLYFNEILWEYVPYDNIKSHTTPGFHPLSRWPPSPSTPPSLLKVKLADITPIVYL